MAIPGYLEENLSAYNAGEYKDYVSGLSEYLGLPYKEVVGELANLRDFILNDGISKNIINTDGRINLDKLPVATRQMWARAEIVIYGNPDDLPVYFGWIDGVKTLIFGERAEPYIAMASLEREQYLIPPNLVLLGQSGIVPTGLDGVGGTLQVVSIAASFMSIYGETNLSNVVQIGPILEWQSVTVGVVEEDIPDYATSVIYYRDFGGTYRRVLEVKL